MLVRRVGELKGTNQPIPESQILYKPKEPPGSLGQDEKLIKGAVGAAAKDGLTLRRQ